MQTNFRFLNNDHWFGRIFNQLRPYYKYALVAAFLTNVLALTVSIFSLVVYDRVIPAQSKETLYVVLAGVGLFLVLDFLIRKIKSDLLDEANKQIDSELTEIIFDNVIVRQLRTKMSDGEVASAVRDFDSFKEFLGAATVSTFVDVPFAILFIGVLLLLAPVTAIVPVGAIVLLVLVGVYSHQKSKHIVSDLDGIRRGRHSALIEILGLKDLVITTDSVSHFRKSWCESSKTQSEKGKNNKEILNDATNRVQLITSISQVLMLSVGALLAMSGKIGTGSLVAISIISVRALAPFSQVVSLLSRLESAIQSFRTLDNIMQSGTPSRQKVTGGIDTRALRADFEIRNLYFSFAGQQTPAYSDIFFDLKSGQKLVILGKSGSGKTSLLRSVVGLYEPLRGEVLLGGLQISAFSQQERSELISCCFQDPMLFAGSIMENITLGIDSPDTRRLLDITEICGLGPLLSALKDGLNHRLYQRGHGLSGGEKQLIALARTLYRNTPVYVFDEPSSNLDPTSENKIFDQIKLFLHDKTVMIATHRSKPLDMSTHCLVLDKGRVSKFGPTSQILQAATSVRTEQAA